MAAPARRTHAARRRPAEGDDVAGGDARDARAHGADDARAFVTEDHRQRYRPVATRRMQIAVAHAGRLHVDQDLAGSWRVEVQRLDRQRLTLLAQDHGRDFHGRSASATA